MARYRRHSLCRAITIGLLALVPFSGAQRCSAQDQDSPANQPQQEQQTQQLQQQAYDEEIELTRESRAQPVMVALQRAQPGWQTGMRPPTGRERAYLGVVLDERQPQAAVVLRVQPNSPASRAGLRPGDEIVSFNGREIRSARDLWRAVSWSSPGSFVEIRVNRPRVVRLQTRLARATSVLR